MSAKIATPNEREDRHTDAEPLFRRALAIYQKAAGPENPAVATILNNVGQVVKSEGRCAEAEPPIRQSLAIREKLLGRDHPDVARSLNNLADLYEREGRAGMPSRFTCGRLPSASTRWVLIIPMSRPRKTISPRSIRRRIARPTRCRWLRRRSRAGAHSSAPRLPCCSLRPENN
jgi:Tetratricopeptide repeat